MNNKSANLKLLQMQIKLFITMILIGLLLFVIISSKAKAYSKDDSKGNRRNMFYMQVINYAVPMVKVNTFDEGDMVENEFSIKDEVLKGVGIDSKNPMSILGKEVACIKEYHSGALDVDNSEKIKSIDVALKPFTLNEDAVNKNLQQGNTIPSTNNTEKTGDENLTNINVKPDAPNLAKPSNTGKPEIFIYHTHTSEGYGPGNGDTTDKSKNVCAVGTAMEKELTSKYGVSVIHDMTIHDAQSYNLSYSRSRETIDKYLKQYGNFKLLIDIHRDEVANRSAVTTKINGENVARFMFVMDKTNSHYNQNLGLVNKMIGISEKLFPGYIRNGKDGKGMYAYNSGKGHFNQDKGSNSILIEVGSEVTTPSEAISAGKYLARIIAEGLYGKNWIET